MNERKPNRPRARRRHLAVLAIAGLAATTVTLAATPTLAEPGSSEIVIDDFDDGDASDWVFFGGNNAGGGGGALADRPAGGSHYLSTGWGGNGTDSGFYGGLFRNFDNGSQVVPPADASFSIWVLNQSNATVESYQLEITLREDLDGDGWTNGADDSVQLVVPFDSGDFDDQWTQITAPLSSFTNIGTGGNGVFDGALDEVVVVVAGVQGAIGSVVELDLDELTFTSSVPAAIQDFESGVLPGTSCPPAEPVNGFCTFNGPASSVALSTSATPPAPVPGADSPNTVLQMDVNSTSFAGFIDGFFDTPQNWSTSQGISLWLYGTGSGSQLFIDVLDNRNPGSTTDDAERWTVAFVDDVIGWHLREFPFSSFSRKEIGNSAPFDAFDRFSINGWALGTLGTAGPRTFYVDDVRVYGVAEPPVITVNLSRANTIVTEGETAQVGVKLNRPLGPDDPAEVSIDFATERSYAVPGEEFTPTSGTLTFVNGGPSELFFSVETFDDTKFEGDEQIVIRLTNPVGAERGSLFQGSVLIDDDDPFDPNLLDDFEQGAFLWNADGDATIQAVRSEVGSPDARPGQDAVEHVAAAGVPVAADVVFGGARCPKGNAVVPVRILSTPVFDATSIDHRTVRLGAAGETRIDRRTGEARRQVADVNDDGLDDLAILVRFRQTGLSCDRATWTVTGETFDGRSISNMGGFDASLVRDFPIAQDWSDTERLDFWYHGSGGGEEITVTLKDNRAPDPGPDGWTLAWADEFDEPAGATPNPANWAYEIGDTTPDGKNGWGNEELQYYTDDPANAATDGDGNLVITLAAAESGQECYYGPCEFESARLITQHKAEFAYGRIESRLRVPDGGPGLWPAFWSLGTDITYNPWPGAGEIDIMEYVSRLPNEIFGTVHGPGYSGGASIGDIYDEFDGQGVASEYHTYAVEWEPDLIVWHIDGIEYHRVTPEDLPGPWVFDKPFFLLLNFAIGGNFGGAIAADNEYPQEYLVDYVRVYQGPDTAERFETTFVDDSIGWRRVSIPVTDFVRSADQPAGAPDDGLSLTDVWGYGFEFSNGTASGEARFDLVERVPVAPPTELVVSTLVNSGEGSLREALALIANGGTITFDPSLSGGSLDLTSGPLVVGKMVTIDGSPGITIDGGGTDRVLVVNAGADVTVEHVTLTNGYGFQLAGCVLNNGTLTLDHSTVTGCTMTTDAGDFWQGGAGIYNGDGATLNLFDSTVSGNTSGWAGGGIFSFFGSTTNVTRSTISANTSADVGGGLRLLGNASFVNSTISGNTAAAWHGAALFLTDGVADVAHTTIIGNTGPGGTAAVFVGTFGPTSATLNLQNSIVAANADSGCFLAPFGAGAVAINSLGGNVFTDSSCFPVGADQVVGAALVDALADNGGPTFTHALLPGSPAIDAAIGSCPVTDQRGVARPRGTACDAGAVEL